MSNPTVRTSIKTLLASEASSEKIIDLTAQFQTVDDMLAEADVAAGGDWVGIEFFGGDEQPATIPATNDQGKYQEDGTVYVHIVTAARLGCGDALLTRGENLRNIFRGRRIGSILIESVTPLTFDAGSTLEFSGGYMSCSFQLSYLYELTP